MDNVQRKSWEIPDKHMHDNLFHRVSNGCIKSIFSEWKKEYNCIHEHTHTHTRISDTLCTERMSIELDDSTISKKSRTTPKQEERERKDTQRTVTIHPNPNGNQFSAHLICLEKHTYSDNVADRLDVTCMCVAYITHPDHFENGFTDHFLMTTCYQMA